MARRRGGRFYKQAELDAMVRYNPEVSGLLELRLQAEQNLKSSIGSARSNARQIRADVKRATPQMKKVYDRAAETQGVAAAQIASNARTLAPVADDLKFAIGGEAANAATRIGEARAASLADLTQRRVGAREGQQFAIQAARSQFATDIGQVLRRQQSLGQEIGAYKASQAGDLRTEAQKRRAGRRIVDKQLAQSERNSQRTHGIDPATGKPLPESAQADTPAGRRAARKARETRRKDWREGVQKIETGAAQWKTFSNTIVEDAAGNKRKPSAAEVEQKMFEEGYTKREIDIARDLLRNGGSLSGRGVIAMREIGLKKIPKRWRPKPKPPGLQRIAGIGG